MIITVWSSQGKTLANTFVYVVESTKQSKPLLDRMKTDLQALKVKPTDIKTYAGTIYDSQYGNEKDVKFHFVVFPQKGAYELVKPVKKSKL